MKLLLKYFRIYNSSQSGNFLSTDECLHILNKCSNYSHLFLIIKNYYSFRFQNRNLIHSLIIKKNKCYAILFSLPINNIEKNDFFSEFLISNWEF